MIFTLGLAQCKHAQDGNAVGVAFRFASLARDRGVDLLVFPESLMSRYEMEKQAFISASQPVGGEFSTALEALAHEFGLWMVYTMNEQNDEGGLPLNTAIIVDAQGVRQGIYRKVHLFDSTYTQESSRMSRGNSLFDPIETPFGRLGLGICYDLRFPEVARHAALSGCDLMLFPAAWIAGEGKDRQWKTLLAARAIENQMYVAGVSRCDKGNTGYSSVFAPDGSALIEGGNEEELLTCRIDTDLLDDVRDRMPALRHRRPELYMF